jgi:hypothetical protein
MIEIYRRYPNVVRAVFCGVRSSVGPEQRKIIDDKVKTAGRKDFNPLPEDVLGIITSVADGFSNLTASGLKKDLRITRSETMAFYVCFTDDNNLSEITVFSKFAGLSLLAISKIKDSSDNAGTVGLDEQFRIGLEVAGGDLTKAAILLAMGTRLMARNCDKRLFKCQITQEDIWKWKSILKPFGWSKNSEEDIAGDTYHFWCSFLAGVSCEEKVDPLIFQTAKRSLCDLIYPNTAWVTENIRHRLYLKMDTWNTHELPDRVGFYAGRALYRSVVEPQ